MSNSLTFRDIAQTAVSTADMEEYKDKQYKISTNYYKYQSIFMKLLSIHRKKVYIASMLIASVLAIYFYSTSLSYRIITCLSITILIVAGLIFEKYLKQQRSQTRDEIIYGHFYQDLSMLQGYNFLGYALF